MKTKFDIGNMVVAVNDPKKEAHEVVGIFSDIDGVSYKVTSREVDLDKKEIVNGFSFYREDELMVKAKK